MMAACGAALLGWPAACWGHGTPIAVNVVGGKLAVSNGVAAATGYADWLFADPDPESWLTPSSPTEQFTTLPGFRISDMNAGEAIALEVISRPDLSAPGRPQRWLWHWSLASEQVAMAPNDPTLDLVSQRGFTPSVQLRQSAAPATPTIKLADLLASDLGAHRHLLSYFLDDSPAAPDGVYGFFARLTAPGYASSDPFLIALNLNVFDEVQFQAAAGEINVVAGLAGDFDADGDADGGDVLVWQREFGLAGAYRPADGTLSGVVDGADLALWKIQFGDVVTLPSATAATTAVPEAGSLTLVACAAGAARPQNGLS